MIAHRRHWYYRIAGQSYAQPISFKFSMSTRQVKDLLRRMLDVDLVEVWAR